MEDPGREEHTGSTCGGLTAAAAAVTAPFPLVMFAASKSLNDTLMSTSPLPVKPVRKLYDI
eukprot:COSAG02_NODE_388_length_23287_cov_109.067017_1_plen_60_part_10